MPSEVEMSPITMEIMIPSIEDRQEVQSYRKGRNYENDDSPFCSCPAGFFAMALGAGVGYVATDAMIDAYKNMEIKVMLACGLFDVFALAIAGAAIIVNRLNKTVQEYVEDEPPSPS